MGDDVDACKGPHAPGGGRNPDSNCDREDRPDETGERMWSDSTGRRGARRYAMGTASCHEEVGMKSRVRSVAVSVVVLLAVAGCGPSETTESGPTPTSPGAAAGPTASPTGAGAAPRVRRPQLGRPCTPPQTV